MRVVLRNLAAPMTLLIVASLAQAGLIIKNDATVDFIDEARVPAQEEGVLEVVSVQQGQEVREGDVLAKIDDTLVQLQLKVAGEELKVAEQRFKDEISIEYARAAARVYYADYNRLKEANMEVGGVVSDAEVELAGLKYKQYVLQAKKSKYEQIISGLEMNVSQAKLDAAKEHIERSKIKAPWDGVVDEMIRYKGDWVKPGDPIVHMVRMDRLRVTCSVEIDRYRPQDIKGRPVTVRVDRPGGPKIFKGTITNWSPLVGSDNKFKVWTDLDNPKVNGFRILMPGMWATMTIETR